MIELEDESELRIPQLAARYRVQGIPNFVVIKNGTPVAQQAGVMRAPDLVRFTLSG